MGELLKGAALAVWTVVLGTAFALAQESEAEPKGEDEPEPASSAPEAAPGADLPPRSQDLPPRGRGGERGDDAPVLPSADLWVLDFHFQKVGSFQPTDGIRRGELYWYMLYRIENKTGKDREAFLSITARSNKDKSYANIFLPDVEPLIERRVGKPLWGKVDEAQALKERAQKGDIKAERGTFNYFKFSDGEVRDCVAIFNRLDPAATHIQIVVEGLSNDLSLIQRENGSRQIRSRAYVLELERPGDEYAMNLDRFRLLGKRWSKKLTELVVPKEG